MSHTPGPWVKDYGATLGHIKTTSPTVADGTPTVARYDIGRQFPDVTFAISIEEQEANGHLIAAAPDLLAALKDLLAACDFDAMGQPFEEGECPACDRARAVIAKAEGKS